MAEENTLESRENLENAKQLVEEFEKEYGRDNQEVRKQERVEEDRDYWRGGFPRQYAAKKLFGWLDRDYNRKYWKRLDKRWKKWKRLQPLRQRRLEIV